jgi:hypothetical protein
MHETIIAGSQLLLGVWEGESYMAELMGWTPDIL